MNITKEQIYEIYSLSYLISESRGKKRQNKINETIIELFKENPSYSDCEFKTEIRLTEDISSGKWFAIDVLIYKQGELFEIVLGKAPASNILQNSVNMINSRFGEVGRLHKYISKGVKLTFINFQPNITPFFKRNGNIDHFEKNTLHNLDNFREALRDNITFSEINITFNISGIEKCKNRYEVKELFTSPEIITDIQVHL